jgi:hypothetical protein
VEYVGRVLETTTTTPVKDANVVLDGIVGVNPDTTDTDGNFSFDIPEASLGTKAILRVTHGGFNEWTGHRRVSNHPSPERIFLARNPLPVSNMTTILGGTLRPADVLLTGDAVSLNAMRSVSARSARNGTSTAPTAAASPAPSPTAPAPRPTRVAGTTTPPPSGWAYYGEYDGKRWGQRYFRMGTAALPEALPSKGDRIEALSPVNVRQGVIEYHLLEGWKNKPLIGFISPGDQLRVLDVETVAGDHVWIHFATEPANPVEGK